MSGSGRSKAAKQRRHAKAMAKRRAEKEQRKLAYQSLIEIGKNAKRKVRAEKARKLVADHKNPSQSQMAYVPASEYWKAYWAQ